MSVLQIYLSEGQESASSAVGPITQSPRTPTSSQHSSHSSGSFLSDHERNFPADQVRLPTSPSGSAGVRARRPLPHLRRDFSQRSEEERAHAQKSMNMRFEGLNIDMLGCSDMLIYSTHDLEAPANFRQLWRVARQNRSTEEMRQLTSVKFVLIFGDSQDKQSLKSALDLALCISTIGEHAPAIIFLPHSATPELQATEASVDSEESTFDALSKALECGIIDHVICGEPSGIKLAIQVHSRILQQQRIATSVNDTLNKHRELLDYVMYLESVVHDTVWDYLRFRLQTGLPEIDPDIEPGQPEIVGGLVVGAMLGEGSFGTVCKLRHPDRRESDEVLKMVRKDQMTDFHGIACLKRQISVMRILSSTQKHPNITKLYEVYHTETHVLFRMEFGGSMDLYKRLLRRELHEEPIEAAKAADLMTQCMAGLCHLHLQANVVHRDLKPENVIVAETPDSITAQIADFDNALIVPGGCWCHGMTGTFPFMAPETTCDMYDPSPADVWSMAMVALEIGCCLKLVSRMLCLGKPKNTQDQRAGLLKIRSGFAHPGFCNRLIRKRVRPELEVYLSDFLTLLEGMLDVDVNKRWTASKISEAMQNMFQVSDEEVEADGE